MNALSLLAYTLLLAAPIDGNAQTFHDDVLERMAGTWNLTGTIRGHAVHHSVDARWILNHQFLEIHETDLSAERAYEALVLLGYDSRSERYVAHWNDIFGGRISETLGYGARSANEILFRFEYPDGPFRTLFRWLPETGEWEWEMRTKNAKGEWIDFGRMRLTRAPAEI